VPHVTGENVLVKKPAAQMLWFWSAPMGGYFAAQRHQQPEECLNHGARNHSLSYIFTAPVAWSVLGYVLK